MSKKEESNAQEEKPNKDEPCSVVALRGFTIQDKTYGRGQQTIMKKSTAKRLKKAKFIKII